jgi:hypothetical protein
MEGLTIHTRKTIKTSNIVHEEALKNTEKASFYSQEQIELLKMLSPNHYPDPIWKETKLAFKVNGPQ